MVNSTVNGKKIVSAAGKDDKVRLDYCICGKKSKEKGLDAKINGAKPSISLISSLRENGQIINETSEYVSIKAYPGKNPNKVKKSEDITH